MTLRVNCRYCFSPAWERGGGNRCHRRHHRLLLFSCQAANPLSRSPCRRRHLLISTATCFPASTTGPRRGRRHWQWPEWRSPTGQRRSRRHLISWEIFPKTPGTLFEGWLLRPNNGWLRRKSISRSCPARTCASNRRWSPRFRMARCYRCTDLQRHVLLELPHELYFPLETLLGQLESRGMQGILSHPERNQGLLTRPELISQLVDNGCLMQVTAGSLMGTFGARHEAVCGIVGNVRVRAFYCHRCAWGETKASADAASLSARG